jgi:hypothetical protein
LHLAALIFDEVNGERLFGFAFPFNYNSFLHVFRNLAPDRMFPHDEPGKKEPSTIVDNQRSIELLQKLEANGWVPFEESVRRSCLGTYGDGFSAYSGLPG